MDYFIKNWTGKTIAAFRFEHDRDVCFDILNEDGDLIKA